MPNKSRGVPDMSAEWQKADQQPHAGDGWTLWVLVEEQKILKNFWVYGTKEKPLEQMEDLYGLHAH